MGKYNPDAKPKYDDRPIPIGTYKVYIKDVVFDKISQNTGNTYCSISYQIQDGEYKDRYIFDNFMYDDEWMWKWVLLFGAIGYTLDAGAEINEISMVDISEELKSKILTIQTKNETDKSGVSRCKVYRYIPKGDKVKGKATGTQETGKEDGFN